MPAGQQHATNHPARLPEAAAQASASTVTNGSGAPGPLVNQPALTRTRSALLGMGCHGAGSLPAEKRLLVRTTSQRKHEEKHTTLPVSLPNSHPPVRARVSPACSLRFSFRLGESNAATTGASSGFEGAPNGDRTRLYRLYVRSLIHTHAVPYVGLSVHHP